MCLVPLSKFLVHSRTLILDILYISLLLAPFYSAVADSVQANIYNNFCSYTVPGPTVWSG